MKDFDVLLAQDREFKIGGETFHWRYQTPEVLDAFSEDTKLEGFALLDAQILLFLEEDEHDRYKAMRASKESAVPGGLIMNLITWLVEQQTSFPTELPSPSVVGRGQTAATSKAA